MADTMGKTMALLAVVLGAYVVTAVLLRMRHAPIKLLAVHRPDDAFFLDFSRGAKQACSDKGMNFDYVYTSDAGYDYAVYCDMLDAESATAAAVIVQAPTERVGSYIHAPCVVVRSPMARASRVPGAEHVVDDMYEPMLAMLLEERAARNRTGRVAIVQDSEADPVLDLADPDAVVVRTTRRALTLQLAEYGDENALLATAAVVPQKAAATRVPKRVDTVIFTNPSMVDELITARVLQVLNDVDIFAVNYVNRHVSYAVGVDAFQQGYLAATLADRAAKGQRVAEDMRVQTAVSVLHNADA